MTARPTLAALSALAVLATAGCDYDSREGGFREQIGLSPGAPDEFLIVASDPLLMPPDLSTLPRPTPGARSRVAQTPIRDAHAALFRVEEPVVSVAPSEGELVLLSGAQAADDNSGIRELIKSDSPDDEERQFGLRTIFGVPIPANLDDLDSVLQSDEELQRLRQAGFIVPSAPPNLSD